MWTKWTNRNKDLNQFCTRVKSRQLNPPLSTEDRQRFERSDEECLATIFLAPTATKIKEVRQEIAADRSAFNDKFARLSAIYQTNRDVEDFLSRNTFLFQPLFQAFNPIKELFGEPLTLRLDVLQEGTSRQLFALISTSLEPKKALAKLAAFDQNWWFHVPHEIHDFLEFTIEFV